MKPNNRWHHLTCSSCWWQCCNYHHPTTTTVIVIGVVIDLVSLVFVCIFVCITETKLVSKIILDNISNETVNKADCIQKSNPLHSRWKCIYSFTLKVGWHQIRLKWWFLYTRLHCTILQKITVLIFTTVSYVVFFHTA